MAGMRTCAWAAAVVMAAVPARISGEEPSSRPAPAPPVIAPLDQAYLAQTARRCLESQLTAGEPYKVPYVPPALRELRAQVAVTLREHGDLVGLGQSHYGPLVEAVVEAVGELVRSAAAKNRGLDATRAAECSLEIEVIGPREPVGSGAEKSDLLAARFEPGLDGIAVRIRDQEVLVRPSQLLSREPDCEDLEDPAVECKPYVLAVQGLLDQLLPAAERAGLEAKAVSFLRFRTRHFWQARPGERPVELIAGMRLVRPEEVTPAELERVIDAAGRYLNYRQLPDGFFTYTYLPGRDRYQPGDQSWVRQMGAVWGACLYAAWSGRPEARQAADRAIEAGMKLLRPLEGADQAMYVATPDRRHKLGATALFGLAILDAPDPGRHAGLAEQLARAIATLQGPGGQLRVTFPSAIPSSESQDYSPGEALLFLARLYDRTRDPRWRAVIERALPYYREYYVTAASPAFVPWQMQAYGQIARSTTLQKYADFVYAMADRLIQSQMGPAPEHDPSALYDGAYDVYGRGRSGISSSAYLEGMVEALRTARAMGDAERAQRYGESVRRAVRFVLQMRFKSEEAFFVRSPTDAVNGFRTSAADASLRIDHVQHSLAALMGARALLWPDSAATRATRN